MCVPWLDYVSLDRGPKISGYRGCAATMLCCEYAVKRYRQYPSTNTKFDSKNFTLDSLPKLCGVVYQQHHKIIFMQHEIRSSLLTIILLNWIYVVVFASVLLSPYSQLFSKRTNISFGAQICSTTNQNRRWRITWSEWWFSFNLNFPPQANKTSFDWKAATIKISKYRANLVDYIT